MSVLEGRGVGFLKQGRVKKLMEDENYRNFVVSRLNTALEKKLTDENQHLEDVVRTGLSGWSEYVFAERLKTHLLDRGAYDVEQASIR